ncbi:MAG: Gfo/Idh/MocA family oxidoreductase [Isosphaeraceae bacterium]
MIKQTGGVLAGSALAATSVPMVHAAEKNTIRLAIVGCGGRGTGAVADALSTEGGPVQLYAMADLFEDRLQSSLKNLSATFKEKVDVTSERCFLGFDAYRKAIDCLSPGDVVLLTTHAAFRPMMFEYAVKKGVNVFMEKSFAVDAPATRRLLRAAEESERKNLKVGVGFMWRHSKARDEAIRRIHDGAIGDVHTLRIYRVHGPTVCPKLPPDVNELEFQIRHAFSFNWLSSSFLIDWHCHNIDVACWAKGAWPVSAQGMGGRCYPEAGNLLDHYTVEFTFPDGTKLFSFSRHMSGCWDTYSDYAHGTKGSAVLMTNLATADTRIYRSQNMTAENLVWRFGRSEPNPYRVEWQRLLDAIRDDRPHNEARRAVEANFTALMGRAAVHTGQFVTMDEIKKSDFAYVKDIDRMSFDTAPPIRAGGDGLYSAPQPGITKEI